MIVVNIYVEEKKLLQLKNQCGYATKVVVRVLLHLALTVHQIVIKKEYFAVLTESGGRIMVRELNRLAAIMVGVLLYNAKIFVILLNVSIRCVHQLRRSIYHLENVVPNVERNWIVVQ